MNYSKPYRELTWTAVLVAIVVGALLNAGICFAGLQIGFTIVGSTVAAVIGFGILRGIFRVGSILEVNIFQTVASCVNTVNAGVIFTVPVLFILGMQDEINYTALVLATSAGSVLGVVLIIPLRKQIIDFERLRFPEGTAVATILKSPGAGVNKAMLLLGGIALSAIISTLTHVPMEWTAGVPGTVIPKELHIGQWLNIPPAFSVMLAVSTLSLGAGYLAGRPGLVVLYGTLLNYWVLIPVSIHFGWVPDGHQGVDWFFRNEAGAYDFKAATQFIGDFSYFTSRNVGIGMILGGALAGIIVAAPALKAALVSMRATPSDGKREEMPVIVLNAGMIVGGMLLLLATKMIGGDIVSWGKAICVTLVGGVWLWIAGLVVAQTTGRTDWSPLSGLALIAIAIVMGILAWGGNIEDPALVVPAVTFGAAICVATSMCADMMADFKTGYLVGSKPIKQQIAQILTCWIGPGLAVGVVILLWEAYAFGPNQAQELYNRAVAENRLEEHEALGGSETTLPTGVPPLSAPQAGALQGAIQIVQSGDVALGKYLTGAALGLGTSILIAPGMGVMVGLSLYLPFEYMAIFGIGGIINIIVRKSKGARFAEDTGVPVAAGLIVGNAVVEVVYAVMKVSQSL